MKRALLIVLVLILGVTVVGVGAWAYLTFTYPGLFNSIGTSPLPCPPGATATSGQTQFRIILKGQGFNGSRYSTSCPLMSVVKGQSVTIHVGNNDREAHGVARAHDCGFAVELSPGEILYITFSAD